MAFGMTACQISKEEQRALEEQSPLAKAYYEEKYDTDIEIEDAFYNYYISDDFFRHYITSEMIFVTNEDTFITFALLKFSILFPKRNCEKCPSMQKYFSLSFFLLYSMVINSSLSNIYSSMKWT